MIYFDHNATAPLMPAAREAWLRAADEFIGNPSSPHRIGGRAEAALADARARLARLLGCDPFDLVWTSGATEGNNQVLHHFARTLRVDSQVWISGIEHPSITESAAHYFDARLRIIPAGREGTIDLNWLVEELPKRPPGLVVAMAANNVTGVLQPWREIAGLCRRAGVPYFCDAVQWVGKEPSKELGLSDFVSGCAHKVGGPRGVGFLKCPAGGRVESLVFGGPQEDGRRAGTENVAGVLAMVAALEARAEQFESAGTVSHRQTRDDFTARLVSQLPGSDIVGFSQPRLWNTVAALVHDVDCRQRWVVKLDKLGFAVSTGSACSSGKETPSPVLTSMGYTPEEAGRVLRFSSGWETTAADWQALLEGILQAAAELKSES